MGWSCQLVHEFANRRFLMDDWSLMLVCSAVCSCYAEQNFSGEEYAGWVIETKWLLFLCNGRTSYPCAMEYFFLFEGTTFRFLACQIFHKTISIRCNSIKLTLIHC